MSTLQAIEAELRRLLEPARRISNVDGFLEHLPRIVCADGLTMSMQASGYHYCSPRDNHGPWNLVEVGFPSRKVDEFMDYMDGSDSDPTETVYGYVPLSIVAEVIHKAGGFAHVVVGNLCLLRTAKQPSPEPGPKMISATKQERVEFVLPARQGPVVSRDFYYGERGFGFVANRTVYLQRCGDCQSENYGPAVASGQCAWCGKMPPADVVQPVVKETIP